MNYFILSFFAGGILTLITPSRRVLLLLQAVFFRGLLNPWQMFIFWGLIFSIVFFVSKAQIEQHGFMKFWKLAVILALFISLFVIFVSDYALRA